MPNVQEIQYFSWAQHDLFISATLQISNHIASLSAHLPGQQSKYAFIVILTQYSYCLSISPLRLSVKAQNFYRDVAN